MLRGEFHDLGSRRKVVISIYFILFYFSRDKILAKWFLWMQFC